MLSKLDGDLLKKIKDSFEPKYGRKISETEAIQIANNLADFMEMYMKFKWRKLNAISNSN